MNDPFPDSGSRTDRMLDDRASPPLLDVERAYEALRLCGLDGDDHTTSVLLEVLGIGQPARRAA